MVNLQKNDAILVYFLSFVNTHRAWYNTFIMENKKFVILDGNAIIHRAYHALPPMTSKGTMVNAVYGFTTMLLKVMNDLKPDYLAVSFDVAGGTFRDKISADYKATRVKADQELYDQIPLCYDVARAFDIPIYTKKGYEADDVIGTITSKCHPERRPKAEVEGSLTTRDSSTRPTGSVGMTIIIVTGDMDTLQLVNENTKVFAMRKGMSDTVLYDTQEVKKKYGFGPEHIIDYKALRGDASDNIPGVPGIGEKTATELIQKIGGIDDIYAQVKSQKSTFVPSSGRGKVKSQFTPSVIAKLKAGEESAEMSYELATIKRDVPDLDFKLADCEVKEMDVEKISELFKKLEFWSLLKRISNDKLQNTKNKTQTNHKSEITNLKSQIIEITEKNLKNFLEEIKKTDVFACKEIENGFIFSTEKNTYVILSESTQGGELKDPLLKKIFEDKNKTLVGHDLKQLTKALLTNLQTCPPANLFDLMIASYIIDSSTRSHDLKSIVIRELGKNLETNEQGNLFSGNLETTAEELRYCLELYPKMKKQLKDIDDQGLFEKIEMALIPVLAEMELNGVAVDTKKLKNLSSEVNKELEKVTKKIWREAGQEFNIASPLQLREILFEKLQISTANIKKGKTGLSTAESELEKIIEEHPIIPMILEHRELNKLQNTYVDVLPALIDKNTGRIHTTFNQAVTTTGRLSSSEPNLQNIPIRTELGREIRDCFVAEEGHSLIVADYSQIELRIVASLAEDKKMIEIFERGEDIHRATAAIINGVKPEDVTKEMRYAAKEVNFGVLYGMGSYGLSWRTGIPAWQAKDFIKKYFEGFSDVKKYLDNTIKFAKQSGYVETLFGRRRYIPELQADNFQLRSAGERMAINMPIQGTAADLMKLAMIEINSKLKTQNSKLTTRNCKLILQVHDELVFEVVQGLEKQAAELIKNTMENVVKLRVPVEVHVDVGKRWGELK